MVDNLVLKTYIKMFTNIFPSFNYCIIRLKKITFLFNFIENDNQIILPCL